MKPPKSYNILLAFAIMIVIFLWQGFQIFFKFFGSWNLNRTIGWGWDITNFISMILINPGWILSLFFAISYGRMIRKEQSIHPAFLYINVGCLLLHLLFPSMFDLDTFSSFDCYIGVYNFILIMSVMGFLGVIFYRKKSNM